MSRRIARKLSVTESAIRYHLKRAEEGAKDGRRRQQSRVAKLHAEVVAWREAQGKGGINLQDLHAWLRDEHGFEGSERSVQRYW